MNAPEFVLEVFLQPGEFYWGDADTRIKTLLGSCVAICVWHPRLHIGGMSHSLLPFRSPTQMKGPLSGRYVTEAMQKFYQEIKKAGTRPEDYHVKFFGGGNMFETHGGEAETKVGARNVAMTKELIEYYGMQLKAENVGGETHRNIIFDLWNGDVWMRRG